MNINYQRIALREQADKAETTFVTVSTKQKNKKKSLVCIIILAISPDKAAGIDKITARLLRLAAPAVAPSIAKLINLSFSTGTFPSRWKTAKVTPLFKNGTE